MFKYLGRFLDLKQNAQKETDYSPQTVFFKPHIHVNIMFQSMNNSNQEVKLKKLSAENLEVHYDPFIKISEL